MIPFQEKLRELHLPLGSYALFGSVVLAARGIREAQDVDVVVKKELWEELVLKYPQHFSDIPPSLRFGPIEIFREWRGLTPHIDEMVDTAEFFEGLPVVRTEFLIAFKKELGRPKDLRDLELLASYLHIP